MLKTLRRAVGVAAALFLSAFAGTPADASIGKIAAARQHINVVYDTSIGASVDANGFTTLPLRAGAHYVFLNATTGSDSNNCLTAAAPCLTPAHAVSLLVTGEGDQLLVAQGTSYANFPALLDKSGYSDLYPTAIRSYDPADAANTAKYGKATGTNRPVFGPAAQDPVVYSPGNVNSENYLAFQGLDFNPGGNVPNAGFDFYGAGSGILVENNLFRYTSIGIGTYTGVNVSHWVFRNNAIYGGWCSSADECGGGIYADGSDSIAVEDNVFWNNGWKIGASRDDDWSIGGPTQHRHALYLQSPTNGVVRRNLIADSSTLSVIRGHSSVKENLFLDNPGAFGLGDDNVVSYATDHPFGEDLEASYNAILGDADINSANPLGWGVRATDGRQGDTSIHHNLIVQSRGGTSHLAPAFLTYAYSPIPSYADWHDNVSYLWAAPGSAVQTVEAAADGSNGTGGVGQTHPTYENNKWDASPAGSNVTATGAMFSKAYAASALYTALGYADKAAFINYAIAHPEAHIQRGARSLLFAGFGVSAPTVTPLNALTLSPTSITNGSAAKVVVFGGTGGSLFTATGLPTGITLSKDHILVADGSTPAGTPSFTITEKDVDGQTRSTTLSLTVNAGVTGFAWNTAVGGPDWTYANSNHTATHSGGSGDTETRGTVAGHGTFDIHIDALGSGSNNRIGLTSEATYTGTKLAVCCSALSFAVDSSGNVIQNGSTVASGSPWTTGDTVHVSWVGSVFSYSVNGGATTSYDFSGWGYGNMYPAIYSPPSSGFAGTLTDYTHFN